LDKQKFITYSTAESLINDVFKSIDDEVIRNEYIEAIRSKNEYPITNMLDAFEIVIQHDSDLLKASDVIKTVRDNLRETSINNKNINFFAPGPDVEDGLNNALKLITLLKSQILSARTDAIEGDNLFGYNAVINDL